MANKIFKITSILLAFVLLLSLELGIQSPFFLFNLTGQCIFHICGVVFDPRLRYMSLFYQLNVSIVIFAYILSVYFGMRVVQKIRQHAANVSEDFVVRKTPDI